MKKYVPYISGLLLVIALGLLYGFSYRENAHSKIDKIKVRFVENAPTFITEKTVNNLLKQSSANPLNKAKSQINLFQLEKDLNADKMIERAEVFYKPSGELQVLLVQRVPVVRIQNGSHAYYLDRKALPMPLSANYSARVPLATGIQGEKQEQECFALVHAIEQNAFFKEQIIGLFRKNNGDYVLNTRLGKHKILFGKPEHIEEKLRKLKVFYEKEWKTEKLKEYRIINLKYKNQVVCSR